MTIGTRTAGAWAYGSTSISTNLPTSVAAGDMMVLFVGCKPYSATIADITGWTRLGTQQTNGTTGSNTDVGSVAWTVYYRQFVNGDSAPTVSITSGNTAAACIFGFTKTESTWATPVAYFGSDTSSGTDYSATMGSSTGIAQGDYLCAGTIIAGNDATLATPTCTASGATVGTVTQAPASNGTTNTGNDCAAAGYYAPVTTGLSTGNAVVGWTLSANQTGGSALVRVRETNRTVAPTVGTVRTVGQAPTINRTWSASPTVGTVRVSGQQPTVAQSTSVSPTAGTVIIAGQQPTIEVSAGDTSVLASFATPDFPPTVGADQQRFRVLVRKTGVANPTVDVSLYENGALVTALLTGVEVTSDTGQILEAYWDASALSDSSGAGVECYVYGNTTSGSKVEVGAIVWESRATETVSVSPLVGTLRVVGQTPDIDQTWSASPTVGTVRLIGQQPTVDVTQTVAPSAGTVRVIGQQPTLNQTWSASPSVGTVRVTGQTPTLNQTWSASPTVGTLRVTGQQPTVTQTLDVRPQAATVRLIGQQATTAQTWSASPTVGTVRLVGQEPTVTQGGSFTVAPSEGTLRIVGQQPTILVPGIDVEQPTGGWQEGFRIERERDLRRARRRAEERQAEIEAELAAERERQELADRLEAQLRAEGVLADSEAERIRLAALVAQYATDDLPNRVQRALNYAERAQTQLSYQLALREMRRVQEEEELAVLMALAMD